MFLRKNLLIIFAILFCISCQNKIPHPKSEAYIEILDERALDYLDPEAEITVISKGHKWTEGPLWLPQRQSLLFTDIPRNAIYEIGPDEKTRLYLKPAGYTGKEKRGGESGANGLLLSPQGALILMQHGDRRVAMMNAQLDEPEPAFISLASYFEGKRLNSPNDGVFDRFGNLYFTDPPYGLPKGGNDPEKELSFQGVYCLRLDGELVLLDSLHRPNGIALSPNQDRLYVSNSSASNAHYYVYEVVGPGHLGRKKLLLDLSEYSKQEGFKGLPDGLKVHPSGLIFATGPGGVWVFDEYGEVWARIRTGEATSNCAFTPDFKTFFMTADKEVLKMKLR